VTAGGDFPSAQDITPEDWSLMRERNRELLAGRLGWPDGALRACRELERQYPCYRATWTDGGLRPDPEPGYRAWHDIHGGGTEWARGLLAAADPAVLAALVAEDYSAHDHAFCAPENDDSY
jgi:hypothetical protein